MTRPTNPDSQFVRVAQFPGPGHPPARGKLGRPAQGRPAGERGGPVSVAADPRPAGHRHRPGLQLPRRRPPRRRRPLPIGNQGSRATVAAHSIAPTAYGLHQSQGSTRMLRYLQFRLSSNPYEPYGRSSFRIHVLDAGSRVISSPKTETMTRSCASVGAYASRNVAPSNDSA